MAQGFYVLEEAARFLGITTDKLKALAGLSGGQAGQRPQIRAFADRGTWRFRVQDLEELGRQLGKASVPEMNLGDPAVPPGTPSQIKKPAVKPSKAVQPPSDLDAGLGAASGADFTLAAETGLKPEAPSRMTEPPATPPKPVSIDAGLGAASGDDFTLAVETGLKPDAPRQPSQVRPSQMAGRPVAPPNPVSIDAGLGAASGDDFTLALETALGAGNVSAANPPGAPAAPPSPADDLDAGLVLEPAGDFALAMDSAPNLAPMTPSAPTGSAFELKSDQQSQAPATTPAEPGAPPVPPDSLDAGLEIPSQRRDSEFELSFDDDGPPSVAAAISTEMTGSPPAVSQPPPTQSGSVLDAGLVLTEPGASPGAEDVFTLSPTTSAKVGEPAPAAPAVAAPEADLEGELTLASGSQLEIRPATGHSEFELSVESGSYADDADIFNFNTGLRPPTPAPAPPPEPGSVLQVEPSGSPDADVFNVSSTTGLPPVAPAAPPASDLTVSPAAPPATDSSAVPESDLDAGLESLSGEDFTVESPGAPALPAASRLAPGSAGSVLSADLIQDSSADFTITAESEPGFSSPPAAGPVPGPAGSAAPPGDLDEDVVLGLGDDFTLAADSGPTLGAASKSGILGKGGTPSRLDSGVRLVPMESDEVRIPTDQPPPATPGDSEFELDFDVGGDSGKTRVSKLGPLPGVSGSANVPTQEIAFQGPAQSKKPGAPKVKAPPPSSRSPFELSVSDLDLPPAPGDSRARSSTLEVPGEELRLDEDVTVGELGPSSSLTEGVSGINLHSPADSGVNLEKKDQSEFELSLDASGDEDGPKTGDVTGAGSGSDVDSEFELTIDSTGELAPLEEPAPGKTGVHSDIFETTDFDVPALEDESESGVSVSLDEDTELGSSDFEVSSSDEDASFSDSGVVALDEGSSSRVKKSSARRKSFAFDSAPDKTDEVAQEDVEAEEDDEPKAVEEEEELGSVRPAAAAAAPASWGALPVVFLLPCVMVMFLLGLMAFELLHGMWGYQQTYQPTGIVVKGISELFGIEPEDKGK